MTTVILTNQEAADACASLRQTGAQIMTVDGDLARRLIAVSKKIQEAHWSRDEADKLDQPEA